MLSEQEEFNLQLASPFVGTHFTMSLSTHYSGNFYLSVCDHYIFLQMLPRDTPLFCLARSHLWFGGVWVCAVEDFFILRGFWKACGFKANMISVGREVETQDFCIVRSI